MNKKRVLFLCTGNSARSPMAEGLVNTFLGDHWRAFSAGTALAERVHPLAVQAMAELGIDISAQRPRSVDDFRGQEFDQVITLCDGAAAHCPFWLGRGQQVHLGLPDPTTAGGSEAGQLESFRRARDAILEWVLGYLRHEEGVPMGNPEDNLSMAPR